MSLSAASLLFQRHFAGHPLLLTAAAACENSPELKHFVTVMTKKGGRRVDLFSKTS